MSDPSPVLSCAVCKEAMVLPRIFPQCGHSLCTMCHLQLDKRAVTRCGGVDVRCPLCRKRTSTPTALRPLNHELDSLLENLVGKPYQQSCEIARAKLEAHCKVDAEKSYVGIDLRRVCTERRRKIALAVYERVLTMVGFAADRGMPLVVINDEALVNDCLKVLDVLKDRLFEENRCHKVEYCNITKELTVEIVDVTIHTRYLNK